MNIQKNSIISLCLLLMVGCAGSSDFYLKDREKQMELMRITLKDGKPSKIIYLKQGWEEERRQWFYTISQGSQLIRYKWFLNLEQSSNQRPFRADDNIRKYGYIPNGKNPLNEDYLPVGFSRDDDMERCRLFFSCVKESWVGFTCTACHTTEITYQGSTIRIDGGPALADYSGFLKGLTEAMEATHSNPEKFNRFATLVGATSKAERKQLKGQLKTEVEFRQDFAKRNQDHPEAPEYGYGRVDAFGIILNELSVTGLNRPKNNRPPSAPVSYPFLWDTPQHDFVQWNGVAENQKLGDLGRNVGEVLGVFGKVTLPNLEFPLDRARYATTGYRSTARVKNLREIEKNLRHLISPKWAKVFPAPDPIKVKQGKKLFEGYCEKCHQTINFPRKDPNRRITAVMMPLKKIGTDKGMALNFLNRRIDVSCPPPTSSGGCLERAKIIRGQGLKKIVPATEFLPHVVGGTILRQFGENLDLIRDLIKKGKSASKRNLRAYKARPLNGIWSTAPYLHNGSVPNLYQLLLPAEKRTKEFYVGSGEFDPENVGFFTGKTENSFLFKVDIDGNRNTGHEYGTGKDNRPELNHPQRMALIEYMKTL